MNHLQPGKSKAPITPEASRDEYRMRFVISYKDLRQLQPKQRSTILLAAAAQMETWAEQMRSEAQQLVEA